MDELNSKKRARDDSNESGLDSPDVKRLRDDLFLDDSDSLPLNQDLASVMKSFEEEIAAVPSTSTESMPVVDLTSDSGDSQPDLGYLLEASDDELGLPPPTASTTDTEGRSEATDLVRADSNSSGIDDFWGSRNRTLTTILSSLDSLIISMMAPLHMMDCSSIPMSITIPPIFLVSYGGRKLCRRSKNPNLKSKKKKREKKDSKPS
ncbi:hypothetical protein CXB51_032410 [Gossypium anomalum]|uniref:Uncharacterized protein n=1 Tax=Gossypium anomalum TaxID=47600 RepID=A0A8J5YE18_9ROSI|nr:hypothetical protein CXB51_032410 [Gossypium anomalum]